MRKLRRVFIGCFEENEMGGEGNAEAREIEFRGKLRSINWAGGKKLGKIANEERIVGFFNL